MATPLLWPDSGHRFGQLPNPEDRRQTEDRHYSPGRRHFIEWYNYLISDPLAVLVGVLALLVVAVVLADSTSSTSTTS